MITDVLKKIKLSSDVEFMEYASHIPMWKYNEIDSSIIWTEVTNRMNVLGYDIKLGCCGKHSITKRNITNEQL